MTKWVKTSLGRMWICDGASDDVEIQAAIDSLGSGGCVTLSAGTFSTSNSISLGNDINFCGQGMYSTVISGIQTINGIYSLGKSGCQLSDFSLVNCGQGTLQWGIEIENSTDFRLRNVRAAYNYESGFRILSNCKRISFESCIAEYNTLTPGWGDGFDLYTGGEISLTNCISRNNADSGFAIYNAATVILTNCVGSYNTENGFLAQIRLSTIPTMVLNGCIGNNNTRSGICYDGGAGQVNGGRTNNNTEHGILIQECSYVTVSGLESHSNGYNGATIFSSTANTTRNKLVGCILRNNTQRGARLYGDSGSYTTSENGVLGCEIFDNTTYGISEGSNTKNNTYAGNFLKGNGSGSFYLSGETGSHFSENLELET